MHYNEDADTILVSNAFLLNLCVNLQQRDDDGNIHSVSFSAKTCYQHNTIIQR